MIERLPNDVDLADWAKILLVKDKVNELVDEVNRQGKAIKNMPFAKVGDEVLIATDDGHKFFKVVMPETPPEKEDKQLTGYLDLVKEDAIADYKKRILDTLWENHKRENYNLHSQQVFAAGIARAIKLVEETG